MPDNWYDDHDGWLGQFNEMVNEALNVDPEAPLEDQDEMAMSDIAAKLAKGTIGLGEAVRRVAEWIAGRHGLIMYPDEESFILDCAVKGYREITDHWKILMLQCGEPGIADGINRIFADPRIIAMGELGDVADLANPPGVGMNCKAWFEVHRLSPTEQKNFQWATETALKMVLEAE